MAIAATLAMALGANGAGVVAEFFNGAARPLQDLGTEALLLGVFSNLIWAHLLGVYRTDAILDRRRAFRRLPLTTFATFAFMLVIVVATKSAEKYSRLWFFTWAVLAFLLKFEFRTVFFKLIERALERGACVSRALSIGMFAPPIASREIESQTAKQVRVLHSLEFASFADLGAVAEMVAQLEIDHVYVSAPWADIPLVLSRLDVLRHLSTRVFVVPDDGAVDRSIRRICQLGSRPAFCAIEESIHGWGLWLKRMEDIILAGLGLLALSPLFALVALAIRIESRGPVFFKQIRTGFNGRPFELWKFRSMYTEMTDHHAEKQTSRNDPRVTRVGRILRRYSIDELPQLINVLQGSMSLIGPRPHALATKAEGRNLEDLVDYYAVRHRVKPGLTGWAQIHGLRGELDSVLKLQRRVDYDIQYIENWTLWLDIKIIFKTVRLVFRDSSAY
ncbi:exopolysaccharide biosynthesis polyprenyl glycosylphosphotransferase [Methylocystis heyeri]|uniref:Exopolysaccharide biosynthesis polyprenyl glycosylphosphotransferase n=1 Tax=Methylocystis heyeri TaxID=391905 RepID=A0A6B8K8A9_9HYPH|nr:exopolysaccharide biosynthesis polyprenyl glycosylphosphotransferase [Methylocystis heyeri]QGM44236.1 exopolysaccharide biosynthesis polyprenyl glycosylphosphotransferase [Methylocystis heyeri]